MNSKPETRNSKLIDAFTIAWYQTRFFRSYTPEARGMENKVAIVGIGTTGFRATTPDVSYRELTHEAATKR